MEQLEIITTILGLTYVILLIRQNIWCWPLSILSAIGSIVLFIDAKLYSEAILYSYFIGISIYGWWTWSRPKQELKVTQWGFWSHLKIIAIGVLGSLLLGTTFTKFTDAEQSYFDSTTTVFSFLASYMEVKKVLTGWVFWIIINFTTILLYYTRSLDYYAVLMFLYGILSIWGYFQWKKEIKNLHTA